MRWQISERDGLLLARMGQSVLKKPVRTKSAYAINACLSSAYFHLYVPTGGIKSSGESIK
jgi:hypothetical protein